MRTVETSGRTDPTTTHGGVFIQNGTPASTGGISVVNMAAIKVKNSASRAGSIILDARNGTLTLPSGSLDADGSAGNQGGSIVLIADTVSTQDGTVITASQDTAASYSTHHIWIAAANINTVGASGLAIHADGSNGRVNIQPENAFEWVSDDDFFHLTWSVENDNSFYTASPLTVSGSGSFTATSIGSSGNWLVLSGYPITFSNSADVTLRTKGDGSQYMNIGFWGTRTGSSGLVLTNTGTATFDASGLNAGDNGGLLNISTDQTTLSKPQVNFQSKGPNSAQGNGGTVQYWTSALTVGASTNVSVDTSASTTGNAGTISFLPGTANLNFGTGNSQIELLANGGTSSGNGGTITSWNTGTMTFSTASAVRAEAITTSGNGKGGSVTLQPSAGMTVNSSSSGIGINVDGAGSGDGGNILLWGAWSNINFGNGVGALGLSAKADGTGNGGVIEIAYFNTVTFSGTLTAAAGQTSGSDGVGGLIDVHDIVTINIDAAEILANAAGSGNGGTVTLHTTGNRVNFVNAPSINASGGDSGLGGVVSINHIGTFNVNNVINVNPGTTGIGTGDFAGSISLNGVTCQQWMLPNIWPESYWNCVNPESPSTLDQLPASVAANLPNNIPATIKNDHNAVLYVMINAQQWSRYFSDGVSTLSLATAGYTFYNQGGLNPVYTAMFEMANLPGLGYVTLSTQWLTETTTHEVGHQLEVVNLGEASSAPYITAIQRDADHLDNAGPACGQSGLDGPFSGLIDLQTRQPFCNGNTLNNPAYAGLTNTEIVLASTPNLPDNFWLNGQGFHEAWAQAFAYSAYANGLSYPAGYFDPTADGLMRNGYFQCARQRAAQLHGGTFTPTYACN